jgi:hypothetical protein
MVFCVLVESNIFKAGAVAMIDNILGVQFGKKLLYFAYILEMGCIKLDLFLINGNAISLQLVGA